MTRMDWEQKDMRRTARWYGKHAGIALDLFLLHQAQVLTWGDDASADVERTTYWQTVADRHAEAAVEWARKAAHAARRSQAVVR